MTFENTDEKQIVSACFKIRLSLTLLTSKKEIRFLLLLFLFLVVVEKHTAYTSELSVITNQVRVCGENSIKTRSRFDTIQ
jgi:hypothetical protein